MSSASKPSPDQKPLDPASPNLSGESRNVLKLTLTQMESDAANEQNPTKSQQIEDLAGNHPNILDVRGSDTFQALQKLPSECDNVEKVSIFNVKHKKGDISSSKVDLEEPNMSVKDPEKEIVKPVAQPRNVFSVALKRGMEQDCSSGTAQNDNSTLNDGAEPKVKDKDVSDLNQSDLDCLNDGRSTLNDQQSSLSASIVANESPGDNHSTLKQELAAKSPTAELKKNVFKNSKPKLDAAKGHISTLKDQISEQDYTKGGNCDLNLSESQQTGREDDIFTLNDGIQQRLTTIKKLESPESDATSQNKSQSIEKDDNSTLKADTDSSSFGQISSEIEDVRKFQTRALDLGYIELEEIGQSTTDFTPSSAVATPSIIITTPLLALITPPEQEFEKVDEESALINQKLFPTMINVMSPAPADQATPQISETTPTSPQPTPTTSENTATSLQTAPPSPTTPSCDQTSPPQETPPSEPATPTSTTLLRGYLMKRGGALKAWKQRWFVFAGERNALVYFRTPKDLTPLGQVHLSHASFTCEGAEPGIFYMHTPERTVTLKAQSEELKFYWLQQLQLRRWIHRPHSASTDKGDTAGAELFPQLECPEEVNTEETTSQPFFLQLSLKHPLIELQNSVQMLRRRSSNDVSQSVFHIPAPPLTSPTSALTVTPLANQEAGQDSRSTKRKSSPGLLQATPSSPAALTPPLTGQVTMRRRTRSFLRRSSSSWSERSRLQQELQDQKELVALLQKALELCQSERRSSLVDQPERSLEGLTQSTKALEDLRASLDQTQAQVEELRTSLDQRDQTILELRKEVRELSEKNQVKQQVIQKLSSCMSRWSEQSSDVDQGSVQSLIQQNLNLQDDLKAFRKQNHFLNSEIHHLSGLWRTSTESQRALMSKVSVQRGQYLRVLRQLQEVSVRDGAQSEALRSIIQDALSLEQSQLQAQAHRDRDQYGFQLVPEFEVDDIKLLIKIQAPDLRSTQSQDVVERPLVARWDQFMSGCRGELSRSPELKSLIRTGVPPRLRPQVWNWIVRTLTDRDQDPLRYQQLCEQMESCPQSGSRPWSRQIDLDLPRTLCTNDNFSSPSSPTLQQLRRILLAFSWENPDIGYCQGLNRIAGLLLLVLGSEEDSFWALKAVVENIMPPEYFSPSLVGSQADQLVLKDFLAEKLPRLSSHLERVGVDVSSSTFTWFLVVFVEVLPSHILMPLWDAFMYEGNKVLFRFSLALFKLKEPEILQLSTPLELHQYFRVLPKTVPDYRRLSGVAFDELNPFPRRAVSSRRAVHLERLQRELRDLRTQQSLFLSKRGTRKSTEDENAGVDQEDKNSEED